MDDLVKYLGAVTRVVKTVDHDGKPATAVIASRNYDTSRDDLWDAITNAERIPRWFLPISGDLRLGGQYQLKGNAGGTITVCEPPGYLAVTWEFAGETSWVNVTLEANGDASTSLTLEHIAHVPEEFWEKYGPGAVGVGWDLTILGLGLHVEQGSTIPPEESQAWMASQDGKSYVRGSGDDWCRAAIADGRDADWARAAAERTRQFYTGETSGER